MRRSKGWQWIIILLLSGSVPLTVAAQSGERPQANPQIQEAERLHQAGYNFFLEREYRKALESFLSELPLRRAAGDTSGTAWSLIKADLLVTNDEDPSLWRMCGR